MNNIDNSSRNWPTNLPPESRELFEICQKRARKHVYIPLFVIFGIPLVIGLGLTFGSIGATGNAKGALLGVGVIFLLVGLILFIVALATKKKHTNAVRYVNAYYAKHPELKPQVKEAIEVASAVAAATPAPSQSAADEIMKAKQLLDSGAITQEEFEQIKKKALEKGQ